MRTVKFCSFGIDVTLILPFMPVRWGPRVSQAPIRSGQHQGSNAQEFFRGQHRQAFQPRTVLVMTVVIYPL